MRRRSFVSKTSPLFPAACRVMWSLAAQVSSLEIQASSSSTLATGGHEQLRKLLRPALQSGRRDCVQALRAESNRAAGARKLHTPSEQPRNPKLREESAKPQPQAAPGKPRERDARAFTAQPASHRQVQHFHSLRRVLCLQQLANFLSQRVILHSRYSA